MEKTKVSTAIIVILKKDKQYQPHYSDIKILPIGKQIRCTAKEGAYIKEGSGELILEHWNAYGDHVVIDKEGFDTFLEETTTTTIITKVLKPILLNENKIVFLQ